MMRVSIVIPAFNAAHTIAQALDSLVVQDHVDWDAVVIDDGSTDTTAAVVGEYVARDKRIRLLSQANAGIATARNAGVAVTDGEWLLFLDSDDWIEPDALSCFAQGVLANPGAGVVHGRWLRVARDGSSVEDSFRLEPAEWFGVVARFCPMAIHSCVVRRDAFSRAGAFDSSVRYCEDWDLWQRIARVGVELARIDAVVASYRMSQGFSIANVDGIFAEGLDVIARGHAPDPRVSNPDPRYAEGARAQEMWRAKLHFACWQGAIDIGTGGDGLRMLGLAVPNTAIPDLDPASIAGALHAAVPLPRSLPVDQWPDILPGLVETIEAFLQRLEEVAGAPALARRGMRVIESLVLRGTQVRRFAIGGTLAVLVDVEEWPVDIVAPVGCERVICDLRIGSAPLGLVELPVVGPVISRAVLRDAIVADHAWDVLGAFFSRHLYPVLRRVEGDGAIGFEREGMLVGTLQANDAGVNLKALHDAVGWTVFLQEFWQRPGWSAASFYDETRRDKANTISVGREVVIEASGTISTLRSPEDLLVEWTVAGVPVLAMTLPPHRGLVTAQRLRAALTRQMGFELARVAVREGLLGTSFEDTEPLHARLAQAGSVRAAGAAPARRAGMNESGAMRLTPSAAHTIAERLYRYQAVLARRPGHPDSSVSRHAILPEGACAALLEAADATGESTVAVASDSARHMLVSYSPDVLTLPDPSLDASASVDPRSPSASARGYDRHYFETVFASDEDPWRYTTDFEQTKYEQTLSLLGERRFRRTLELACAEGRFTRALAAVTDRLVATDIAQVALDRAAAACNELTNVELRLLDFATDALPGQFDLIVCSEALYYLRDRAALRRFAKRIVDALESGALFLTAHSTVLADDASSTGLDWDVPFGARTINETVEKTPGIRKIHELRTPYYRIALFERITGWQRFRRVTPVVREVAAARLPSHLVTRYQIGGGMVSRGGRPEPVTHALPILLYHRIASDGVEALAKYRVTPDAFASQMKYLRDAGFHTVTLDEWAHAKRTFTPLPGRAVMITFDDGCTDFATAAWPVLRRHELGAMVFVVSDRVGGHADWMAPYGETPPLLGWKEIRRLHDEGVEFGSHTATHPHLEALTPTEVVREAALSRATLSRELGIPTNALAYPNGSEDRCVQHLVGASGYTYGLSCRAGLSTFTDPLLALRRIEVLGGDTLADFVRKLG